MANFLAGNKSRPDESPPRVQALPKHLRQFQSYDAMMLTAGHRQNVSSVSTSQDSPTKSPALVDVTLGYRERVQVANSGLDLSPVWQCCLSFLAEPRMTETKRMYLLLLFELVRKGNLDIIKLLFCSLMRNEPKSVKVSVTAKDFLGRFSSATQSRVNSLTTADKYARAVWDFTRSDNIQAEDLFQIVPIEEATESAVISESLSSADIPDDEDAYTTPEKRRHERTGTTIYHEEPENPHPANDLRCARAAFHPGNLLESLIKALDSALTEDVEDTELVMVRTRVGDCGRTLQVPVCGFKCAYAVFVPAGSVPGVYMSRTYLDDSPKAGR